MSSNFKGQGVTMSVVGRGRGWMGTASPTFL